MPLFQKKKTKQEIEIERDIAYRRARNTIERHAQSCQQLSERYWDQGKKAAQLGDDKMLRQFSLGYLSMQERIKKSNRLLMYMENLNLQRQQVKLSTDFVEFAKDMSEALKEGVSAQGVAQMETELSKALVEAEKVDISLSTVMDRLNESILASPDVKEKGVDEIAKSMEEEALLDEKEFDVKIEDKLKQIEDKMKTGG